MKPYNNGLTILELMVVMAIFTILFAAILTTLTFSDRSFRAGQNKLTEQQEARKALDNMTLHLRESNPKWEINGTNYSIAISDNYRRIDFYQPNVNSTTGNISLRAVTFKPYSSNNRQLAKKTAPSPSEVIIANEVENITFGGGCPGCSAFNCSNVSKDCPVVEIKITTDKKTHEEISFNLTSPFNLTSQIALRNLNITLPNETEILAVEE